ncbi:hypothetical protein ACWOFR_03580 [Carnobacterium gallinarum]|uniref:hypothetical protein n=1 Tax=Carnobacterium gallinarum TaxID=2749 RepID=UPI00054D487C|nr:hypothetical protein [Carnobacterium gallinarum]
MDTLKHLSNKIQDLEDKQSKLRRKKEHLDEVEYEGRMIDQKCDSFFDELAHFWQGDTSKNFLQHSSDRTFDRVRKLQADTLQQIEENVFEEKKIREDINRAEKLYHQEKNKEGDSSWD